ncbi:formimidoylglutamase [uncultured Polaribacter sp.]|uniref:formimidoylglutamase n=1 Tax=uncultured Polaribacter sp. TaxID=174711 RepID=UPI00262DFD1E|nr:formimidoylglutamase [uncultured Polaribacter sp.]
MKFFKDLKVTYKAADINNYSGRKTPLKNQYWYQNIKIDSLENIVYKDEKRFGIIGYACDEGVRRNFGRIGTKHGPESIRKTLGKLPIHYTNKTTTDYGDLICIENNLEDCQEAFSKSITELITNGILPIGIGGGHDIAYANFNGINNAIKSSENNKIGIINFDAHFDLRKVETQPNSGTPFNQILSKNDNAFYFAIGIQQQSNTKELFKIAKEHNVKFVTNFDCETFTNQLKNKLKTFIQNVDYLYITIDLDGFSSAFAPGVSAPSAYGFTPLFVCNVLAYLLKTKKVISCDIAELNPKFDQDNTTAKLAVRLVDYIILKA